MPRYNDYPATVAEVLDDAMTFNADALRAVKALRREHAWTGEPEERLAKFQRCTDALADAYDIDRPTVVAGPADCYIPATHTIVVGPSFSVLSLLHEFTHARGYSERFACKWSINIFRRLFPNAYSRLVPVGHMLVRREPLDAAHDAVLAPALLDEMEGELGGARLVMLPGMNAMGPNELFPGLSDRLRELSEEGGD